MDGIVVAGAVVGIAGGITGLAGGVAGGISAYVNWRGHKHTVQRDAFQDYCASYEKRIAMLTELDDQEKLKQTRVEYEQTLQAWQQKQELAALVPRGAVSADAPRLPPEQLAQLAELLAGSTRLPANLLTADDYFARGNAYYEAGDYQQALEAYNRALELEPDHPNILNNRGNALDELERYEEALKDYNRALELEPDHPNILNNRGNTLGNMGRNGDALKDLERAVELEPDNARPLYNRGNILQRLGRHEAALGDLNRALELTPNDADTLCSRSIALTALERHEEAFRDLNRALELKPGDPCTLYNRACAYSLTGKSEEALPDLEAAIKGGEKYRAEARTDEDFETLRNDPVYGPQFWEIVGREDSTEA